MLMRTGSLARIDGILQHLSGSRAALGVTDHSFFQGRAGVVAN